MAGHRAPMRLYNAQQGCCYICGEKMLITPAKKLESGQYDLGWTREHVVPLALGGKRAAFLLAHVKCNNRKGCNPPAKGMIQDARNIWKLARLRRRA